MDNLEVTKRKKQPMSDFEIARTILQRTNERKLPYLLKNMNSDKNILVLCSQSEEDFTYGSSKLSICLVEFTSPELKEKIDTVLSSLYGYKNNSDVQLIINIRDQMSKLAEDKGNSMSCEVKTNSYGAAWTEKKNANGTIVTAKFSSAIESLHHFQTVDQWCESYKHLLTTDNPDYVYLNYTHGNRGTYSILDLKDLPESNSNIRNMFHNGIRTMVTKGYDVLVDRFVGNFIYPVITQDIILFNNPTNKGSSRYCQMAHRLIAEDWRMILIRPNNLFFPNL